MIRGVVIPKHEHEKFLALSNPSDILDLSRTHSVFWGLAAKTRLITHSNAPVMAAVTFRCSARIGVVETITREDLKPVGVRVKNGCRVVAAFRFFHLPEFNPALLWETVVNRSAPIATYGAIVTRLSRAE